MKLTIANAALILSMAGFASAATVNVNGYINVNFTTNADAVNTMGGSYQARVGRYTGGSLTSTTVAADISSAWTQVGSYTFATAAAGGFNGSFKGDPLTFSTSIIPVGGQNVWLWVTNGTNQNLLMQAINGAAGDFQFKTDGVDLIPTGELAVSTAAVSGWQLALGTFTTGGVNAAYGGSYVLNTAVPIPEPSAALLGAFGAIGLLRRRRI